MVHDCVPNVNTHYSRLNLGEYPSGLYNDLKVAITISNNKEDLLFSILSLAEMLSASIKFFDEEYYYKEGTIH